MATSPADLATRCRWRLRLGLSGGVVCAQRGSLECGTKPTHAPTANGTKKTAHTEGITHDKDNDKPRYSPPLGSRPAAGRSRARNVCHVHAHAVRSQIFRVLPFTRSRESAHAVQAG